MTIALIAHDSKKELMVQFCTAYCRILSQHKLVATGTTGKMISEATGLQVQRFLAGVQGGGQQIASRIACNEIDLLLFFRDPINAKPSEPNEMTLLRLCDVHNIPMATNIATAEVLGSGNDARFAALLTAADKLGIQYIATGHHARVELGSDGVHTVCPAVDTALDESAALAALPQDTLARLLLPLGEFTAADVQEMAQDFKVNGTV